MGMSWENKEKTAIDNYQAQFDKEKKVRGIEDIQERIEKVFKNKYHVGSGIFLQNHIFCAILQFLC